MQKRGIWQGGFPFWERRAFCFPAVMPSLTKPESVKAFWSTSSRGRHSAPFRSRGEGFDVQTKAVFLILSSLSETGSTEGVRLHMVLGGH